MVRRTFASVLPELVRVAGQTGMSMNDARVKAYVNTSTEEFMNEFDFPQMFDRLRFNVTTGRITLPSSYERVAMMTLCGVPMQMQSPWFEFVGYGMDLLQNFGDRHRDSSQLGYLETLEGVLDREDCATFRDIPTSDTHSIRVIGLVDERVDDVRPVINIQGYDATGSWIRTATGNSYYDGVNVEINGDTAPFYVDSIQTISAVTAISKPTTKANVYLYAMPYGGGNLHIGTYAPNDLTPMYRRYQIPCLQQDRTYRVLARCRRRYVPVVDDADYLIISNLPALKAMMMSINYLESDEPEKYAAYKSIAVDILKKEAKAYIGAQRQKPLITFSEEIGVGRRGLYIR